MIVTRAPAILLLSLPLGACSSGPDLPKPVYVPPSPPTEQAIVMSVPAIAGTARLSSPLQISDVRPADRGGPGSFYVCVRETNPPPNGRPRYYAVFFDNDEYKGDRMSVIMDQCETQTYRALPAPAPPPAPTKPSRKQLPSNTGAATDFKKEH